MGGGQRFRGVPGETPVQAMPVIEVTPSHVFSIIVL